MSLLVTDTCCTLSCFCFSGEPKLMQWKWEGVSTLQIPEDFTVFLMGTRMSNQEVLMSIYRPKCPLHWGMFHKLPLFQSISWHTLLVPWCTGSNMWEMGATFISTISTTDLEDPVCSVLSYSGHRQAGHSHAEAPLSIRCFQTLTTGSHVQITVFWPELPCLLAH